MPFQIAVRLDNNEAKVRVHPDGAPARSIMAVGQASSHGN